MTCSSDSFARLLEEVLDDATLVQWDRLVNGMFHQDATGAGIEVFNAVTLLGSVGAWAVVAGASLWLWRGRHVLLLSAWLGTNFGGLLLEWVLKTLVHRRRPEYAAAYLHRHSYSFPNGHSMQSTITYVMLVFVGSVASRRWHDHRRALLACAVILTTLVGFSRLYLGVHYPGDVVGGIAAGTAWVSAALIQFNLAARQKLMRDRLSLTLRVIDPFDTSHERGTTVDARFIQTSDRARAIRGLLLSASWMFGPTEKRSETIDLSGDGPP